MLNKLLTFISQNWVFRHMLIEYINFNQKGLETGSRAVVTHVVKNGGIIFAFESPLGTDDEFVKEHSDHLTKHGDGVKDIAFTVEDATHTYNVAVSRGAVSISEPAKLEDENGWVIIASVKTYGDTIHTFVERSNFKGAFLPKYKFIEKDDLINDAFGTVKYGFIDHVVGNHGVDDMEPTIQWYEKMLNFHRFWSVDDSVIHTEYR
jgi:4-hydroxyphenylpyruvate dioxygenase